MENVSPETIDATMDLIQFNDQGLVPAIAQEEGTGAVLMMAWMNREAVRATLETGDVTYWSRSRQELWRKGATSGNTQTLVDFRIDCDGDTLLLQVQQNGPACHTNVRTCFFKAVRGSAIKTLQDQEQGPR